MGSEVCIRDRLSSAWNGDSNGTGSTGRDSEDYKLGRGERRARDYKKRCIYNNGEMEMTQKNDKKEKREN